MIRSVSLSVTRLHLEDLNDKDTKLTDSVGGAASGPLLFLTRPATRYPQLSLPLRNGNEHVVVSPS